MPLPDAVEDLQRLCAIGRQVAPERLSVRERKRMGELLLIRMLLISTSVIRLLRGAEADAGEMSHVDPFSVASLVRDLVEAHTALDYLFLERVDEDEEAFRIFVYSLHQHAEEQIVISSLNLRRRKGPFDTDFLVRSSSGALERNAVFQRISSKQQKELLRGKKPFFRIRPSTSRSPIADEAFTRGMYKLLSNAVHSHPLAISLLVDVKDDAAWLEFDEVLEMAVAYGVFHQAWALKAFISRRRLGKTVDVSTLHFLRKTIRRYERVFAPMMNARTNREANEGES